MANQRWGFPGHWDPGKIHNVDDECTPCPLCSMSHCRSPWQWLASQSKCSGSWRSQWSIRQRWGDPGVPSGPCGVWGPWHGRISFSLGYWLVHRTSVCTGTSYDSLGMPPCSWRTIWLWLCPSLGDPIERFCMSCRWNTDSKPGF